MEYEFVSRYGGSEATLPDHETMCRGRCEGTGWVPVHRDDPNDKEGNWHDLWLEAEKKAPTDDQYHFVKCPACKGSGKKARMTQRQKMCNILHR